MDLASFIDKWSKNSSASERSNKDSFLNELCAVLGVPKPDPKTGDPERDQYVFEYDVPTPHEGGKVTTRKIDLYKHDCFILEAKQGSNPGDRKPGFARRGTDQWNAKWEDARGQAVGYALDLSEPPPFIVLCDIGYCFDLFASFDGARYKPFLNGLQRRIFLKDLTPKSDAFKTLQALFTDPLSLDPSHRAIKVTREIAEKLARLAKSLDKQGHAPELVAKFLMRCLFTMFAEDVALLPGKTFTKMLEERWVKHPDEFASYKGIPALWRTMDLGGVLPIIGDIPRFNGGVPAA